MSKVYCVDERHATPCPEPCPSCWEEGCNPDDRVEADTPLDAAQRAGWTSEYVRWMTEHFPEVREP